MLQDEPPYRPADTSEIDFSSAFEFMERNGVGRLNLTIEAVGVREEDLRAPQSIVAVLEHASMSDDETPSPYGLTGVFSIFTVVADV